MCSSSFDMAEIDNLGPDLALLKTEESSRSELVSEAAKLTIFHASWFVYT